MLEGAEYDYKKIDCWSAGGIVFFMLVGHSPFYQGEKASNDQFFMSVRTLRISWSLAKSKNIKLSDACKSFQKKS